MITKESEDRLKAWLHWKTAELERGQLDESEKLFYSDIKGLLAERDAYREAAINMLCNVFKESDAAALKGLPVTVRIPRREVVTKHLDAEAARILEGKGELPDQNENSR